MAQKAVNFGPIVKPLTAAAKKAAEYGSTTGRRVLTAAEKSAAAKKSAAAFAATAAKGRTSAAKAAAATGFKPLGPVPVKAANVGQTPTRAVAAVLTPQEKRAITVAEKNAAAAGVRTKAGKAHLAKATAAKEQAQARAIAETNKLRASAQAAKQKANAANSASYDSAVARRAAIQKSNYTTRNRWAAGGAAGAVGVTAVQMAGRKSDSQQTPRAKPKNYSGPNGMRGYRPNVAPRTSTTNTPRASTTNMRGYRPYVASSTSNSGAEGPRRPTPTNKTPTGGNPARGGGSNPPRGGGSNRLSKYSTTGTGVNNTKKPIVSQSATQWNPPKNGKPGFVSLKTSPNRKYTGRVRLVAAGSTAVKKGSKSTKSPLGVAVYNKGRNTRRRP